MQRVREQHGAIGIGERRGAMQGMSAIHPIYESKVCNPFPGNMNSDEVVDSPCL